jgi:hypothetical protein
LEASLRHAEAASDQCPTSLSCAALRATLVLDVLIEQASLGQDAAPNRGLSLISRLSDQQCKAIKRQFRDAVAACARALSSPEPYLFEPLITIAEESHASFDPCSLVSRSAWGPPRPARHLCGVPGWRSITRQLRKLFPTREGGLLRAAMLPGPGPAKPGLRAPTFPCRSVCRTAF